MNYSTYIAIAAVLWLLVLSVVTIALSHGNHATKEQYRSLAALFVVLAWISVAGVSIYQWVKVWLFG